MYKELITFFKTYWSEYGGWRAFASSPFTHFAVIISFVYELGYVQIDWRTHALDSLPTILGFSLAAYAITFALSGTALHKAMCLTRDVKSGIPIYQVVNATFFHAIIVQIISFLFSYLTEGTLINDLLSWIIRNKDAAKLTISALVNIGEVIGCFITAYAFLLLVAIALAMFRIGRLTTLEFVVEQEASNDRDDAMTAPQALQKRRLALVVWFAKILGVKA